MNKAMIKFLQGSAVPQTVFGGLTLQSLLAIFLQRMSTKNYENWLEVNNVIAVITSTKGTMDPEGSARNCCNSWPLYTR